MQRTQHRDDPEYDQRKRDLDHAVAGKASKRGRPGRIAGPHGEPGGDDEPVGCGDRQQAAVPGNGQRLRRAESTGNFTAKRRVLI
jgi:hypothetical protein